MVKQVWKFVLFFLLIFLAVVQAAFLANHYLLKSGSADANVAALSDIAASADLEPTSKTAIENSDIILVASYTGDEVLQAAVAKARTSVVYITGKKSTTEGSIPSNALVSFAPASLTAGDRMGSGIIFDSRGYILTNNHVVADLTDIQVSLFGIHNNNFSGKIIFLQPELDLAVIKIDTNFLLSTITLGDSDMLEVTDKVMAVGCPFSLEQSVTHGIISDTSRTVDIDGRQYVDLLQTDAAINSGNSGGALINMHGDLVGINVAIYAPTRYYCGIGFAIPVNRAKRLLRKLQYLKGEGM